MNRSSLQKKQGKIPDYLWKQVKSLTDNYSLTKICTTLKVSHHQIKENLFNDDNAIDFVEIDSISSVTDKYLVRDDGQNRFCLVELVRPSGEKLKIDSIPAGHITHIISAFMR
ncbi:TPA: hypothetical protein ACX87D_000532 [Legionella pneumophila]